MPGFPPAHTYGATAAFLGRARATKRGRGDVEMASAPAAEPDLAEQRSTARDAQRKLAAAVAAAAAEENCKTADERDGEFLRAVAQRRNLYGVASTAARANGDTNPFLEPPGLISSHDGNQSKYHYAIPEPAINKMLQSLYDDEAPETGMQVQARAPGAGAAMAPTLIGTTGLGKQKAAGDAQTDAQRTHSQCEAIIKHASVREFTKKLNAS